MMRQAGRYLPEYRALRGEEAFFSLVRTPELAAEITLQPIERFPLDAAIVFSDILVVPQAMGMAVDMVKGQGPVFRRPIAAPADLARLHDPDLASALDFVFQTITLARHRLAGRVPLIGFCGAPWTLLAYMVEGTGSKTFSAAKSWLFRYPEASHALLQRLTDLLVDFLVRQIDAGAQLVQVFDSWAGLLGPDDFRRFSFPYLTQIASRLAALRPDAPRTIFARGAHFALETLAETDYDVIGLDWTIDPREARRRVAGRKALQGNLDPCVLYAPPEAIRESVRAMLDAFGPGGYIANLGHGMHPDHHPDRAAAFIEAVQELSAEGMGVAR
jgi:uroporphyrinogen decarboxylase